MVIASILQYNNYQMCCKTPRAITPNSSTEFKKWYWYPCQSEGLNDRYITFIVKQNMTILCLCRLDVYIVWPHKECECDFFSICICCYSTIEDCAISKQLSGPITFLKLLMRILMGHCFMFIYLMMSHMVFSLLVLPMFTHTYKCSLHIMPFH